MIEKNSIEPDIGTTPDIESSSDEYAKRFSGRAGAFLLSHQCFYTEKHIRQIGAKRVLDVGGGHAQNVPVIESMGIALTVTGSTQACATRVNRLKSSKETQFICSNLQNLALAPRQFPHVISYRIVSHMADWHGFIQELCRVSSNAVTIDFAATRSVNFFSELAFKLKHGQEQDTRRYNVIAEADIDQAFKTAGFSKEIRSPQFFFPMAIHRKLSLPVVSKLLEGAAKAIGLNALFGSPIIVTYRRDD